MHTYTDSTWSHYSRFFISITTSYQIDIYKAIAPLLSGDVADFGCGAAKVAPYILESSDVDSYTGIDASADMLHCANEFMKMQSNPQFDFIHSRIDELPPMTFDSGLSVNSYYTWQDPLRCLESIASALRPGATFILISPNKRLDMASLLNNVTKEVGAHPDFQQFCEINQQLVNTEERNFVAMNTLIEQCNHVGLETQEAHQKFYEGGLNYLKLNKSFY